MTCGHKSSRWCAIILNRASFIRSAKRLAMALFVGSRASANSIFCIVLRRRTHSAATPNGCRGKNGTMRRRSEEHTSELQSHLNLVCRLLLEKKKTERDILHH